MINCRALPTINDADFQDLLDILQQQNEGPVYFVGAFGGGSNDPIHRKTIEYQWSGLLIEPIKQSFDMLRHNYINDSNIVFENVVISREHGARALYGGGQSPAASLQRNIDHDTGAVTEELMMCITLKSLLKKHHIRRIDLLHVDVEGQDIEIIEDFDFIAYYPAVINFETNTSPARINATLERLSNLGYTLYNHIWDQAKYITATTLDW